MFAAQNKVSAWAEIERLAALPKLRDLHMIGNPLQMKHTEEGNWRVEVVKRLPGLKILDGQMIEDEEREAAKAA